MNEDRIAHPWGTRTPYDAGGSGPVRVDAHLADGVDPDQVERWVWTPSLLLRRGLFGVRGVESLFGRPPVRPLPHADEDRTGSGVEAAEPDAWVELNGAVAEAYGFAGGDLLHVATPRGAVKARLRIGGGRDDKLLRVAWECLAETKRQAEWANSKIEESSPQTMAS